MLPMIGPGHSLGGAVAQLFYWAQGTVPGLEQVQVGVGGFTRSIFMLYGTREQRNEFELSSMVNELGTFSQGKKTGQGWSWQDDWLPQATAWPHMIHLAMPSIPQTRILTGISCRLMPSMRLEPSVW